MKRNLSDLGLFIPTLNARREVSRIVDVIQSSGLPVSNVLIIDSESSDGTLKAFSDAGIHTQTILKSKFTHGRVRQLAFEYFQHKVKYLIVATQDVNFSSESIQNLYSGLVAYKSTGLSYARQVSSHPNTVEYYDKLYNYPNRSVLKTFADKAELGSDVFFSSDAFAIYRIDALRKIGGFPENIRFAEDAYVAGKMLLAGYDNYYNAGSIVIHNNSLSYSALFRRYRAIAQFYAQESWLNNIFGKNESKGKRLVKFELREAIKAKSLSMMIRIILSSVIKLIAYKLPVRT